ncbi:zf-AN1 type zinc finger protein, involved in ER membrane translocation [Schizosaccharomyces osmophilus]|uniref:Zf-AN1 type zinc finger protein, involved in ER membrane translocation n=1 Tax=Schizosaccharomyces osmophilus TaxID=2545709 RepID=A0AAF0AUM5_9SCHI|nr:zf-AN1 type zinc finger protein, involved in ER membrane translocation [Schizosaccharomyces osmophilus]WBW72646.1 zf-AN1 type zinc finger protein, involved in ER membrane translocation [Schizosaccharomyces osmophilus]
MLLQILSGRISYTIDIHPDTLIGQIFDLLSRQGILPDNAKLFYRFYYHGARLNMDLTCNNYGISQDSVICLSPLSSSPMDHSVFDDSSPLSFYLSVEPMHPSQFSSLPSCNSSVSASTFKTTIPPLPPSEQNPIKATASPPSSHPFRRRCSQPTCTKLTLRLAGHCLHCDMAYCAAHRLMEDHDCNALKNLRKEEHERNRLKLEKEHCDGLISKV